MLKSENNFVIVSHVVLLYMMKQVNYLDRLQKLAGERDILQSL